MPWTPSEFRKKHNAKLSDAQASKAAEMANAMLRSGVPEGIAIATANKHAENMGKMPKKEMSYKNLIGK